MRIETGSQADGEPEESQLSSKICLAATRVGNLGL